VAKQPCFWVREISKERKQTQKENKKREEKLLLFFVKI
jgi:hypothetical protein